MRQVERVALDVERAVEVLGDVCRQCGPQARIEAPNPSEHAAGLRKLPGNSLHELGLHQALGQVQCLDRRLELLELGGLKGDEYTWQHGVPSAVGPLLDLDLGSDPRHLPKQKTECRLTTAWYPDLLG